MGNSIENDLKVMADTVAQFSDVTVEFMKCNSLDLDLSSAIPPPGTAGLRDPLQPIDELQDYVAGLIRDPYQQALSGIHSFTQAVTKKWTTSDVQCKSRPMNTQMKSTPTFDSSARYNEECLICQTHTDSPSSKDELWEIRLIT